MTRRTGTAAAAILATIAAAACGPTPRRGPDVLVVVMDTTRADRTTVGGYARDTTPHLAAFARDAVTFTDAWSPSPWTGPAHASLFTGLPSWEVGLVGAPTPHLDDTFTTFAESLAEAGWSTACWSANPFVAPAFGLTQGFAHFEDLSKLPAGDEPAARVAHRRALAWMTAERRAGRPFLAFVNDMEPHAPYDPPAAVARRFLRPGTAPVVEDDVRRLAHPRTLVLGLGREPLTEPVRAAISDLYDAEVATVDEELGALFEGMRREGLLDDTVVVVTSDHGEGLGDHGWIEHGVFLHRELLRVPLVVRVPGRLTGGRVVPDVVRLEDVAPTILEACGRDAAGARGGRSLLGDVAGRTACAAEQAPPDWVDRAIRLAGAEAAAPLRLGRVSVRQGRHHLIGASDGSWRLFDVVSDPEEIRDLSDEAPGVLAALRAVLPPPIPR